MEIFFFGRGVEGESPVERPPDTNISACNIFPQNISETWDCSEAVILGTVVGGMLVFRAVIKLPLPESMLLVDIYAPLVNALSVG